MSNRVHEISVSEAIGLPEYDGWASVVESKGALVTVALALHGDNARNIGRDTRDVFSDMSLHGAEDVYRALQSAIEAVEQKGCTLSLAAVAQFSEEKPAFATYNSTILLRRDNEIGTVLQSENALEMRLGEIESGDMQILLTEQAESYGEEIRLKLDQGFDMESIIDSLSRTLRASASSARSAIAVVGVGPEIDLDEQSSTKIRSKSVEIDQQPELSPDREQKPVITSHGVVNESFQPKIDKLDVEQETKEKKPEQVQEQELEQQQEQEDTLTIMKDIVGDVLVYLRTYLRQGSKRATDTASSSLKHGLRKVTSISYQQKSRDLFHKTVDSLQILYDRVKPGVIYVRRADNRKRAQIFVPLLLLLMAIVGFFFYRNYQFEQQLSAARQGVDPLYEQFQTAQDSIEVDPIQTRQTVQSILDDMTVLSDQDRFSDDPARSYLDERRTEVVAFLDQISGQEEFSELPRLYDLRATDPDFIAQHMLIEGQTLYLFDAQRGQGLLFDTEDRSVTARELENISQIKDVSFEGDTLGLLTPDGIITQVEEQTATTMTLSIDELPDGSEMIAQFGDAWYVLSTEQRTLERFRPDSDGDYSDGTAWLRSAAGLNFDSITDVAIDGDVWFATDEGDVLRFSSGRPEPFSLSGLEEPFTGPLQVWVEQDVPFVYMLDTTSQRIVVIRKEDGLVVQEVVSGSLAAATAFTIQVDSSRAIITDGAALYSVDIQTE